MLRDFAIRFLVEAIAFGIALAITSSIFGRKQFLPFWFFFFGFALTDAACRALFKHYPQLNTSWMSYAVVSGISLAACLPVLLLMALVMKRRKRHDLEA